MLFNVELLRKIQMHDIKTEYRERGIGDSVIVYLLEAFFVAFSLVSVYGLADLPETLVVDGVYKIIYNFLNGIRYALNNNVMNITVYFLATFWCLQKWQCRCKEKFYLAAVFMGLLQTMVKAYKDADNLTIMFESTSQILITLINIAGYAIIYNMAFKVVRWLVCHDFDVNWKLNNKLKKAYNERPFLSMWLVLLLAWSIHIIIKYPGAMTSDNWGQLTQYNGMFPLYSHWPPFHTVLLGMFVYTGDKIYSTNLGLFSYVMMQWIVLSAIMAYSLEFMRKHGVRKELRFFSLALYSLCPLYTGFVGVVEKDVLYAGFFVLFVLQIMEYLLDRSTFWTLKNVCLLIIAGAMVGLFRKNGNYVILPTMMVICADYIIWTAKGNACKKIYIKILFFACPVVLSLLVNNAIIARFNIRPGNVAEALSMPIQQTARYVRDFEDELSDADWERLSEVYDGAESIPSRYAPDISDPVKGLFKNNLPKETITAYLDFWVSLFFRHPITYIEAVVAQNYYLLDMNIDNNYYYRDFHMWGDDRIEFFEAGWLQPWQDICIVFYKMLHNLPVIGILSDMAFYMVLLLILFFMAIREKNKYVLLASVPYIVSFLIVIAGPVVHTSTRYTLQIIYAMPLYFAFNKIAREKR